MPDNHPQNAHDYPAAQVEAAKRVLVELSDILGAYREKYRLVGGWVPAMLYPEGRHVGSIDIDILLNHTRLEEGNDIVRLLEQHGYERNAKQTYTFSRKVTIDGITFVVDVDFLAGKYRGKRTGRRTQHIQDLKARMAPGGQFAFEQDARQIELQAPRPDGSQNTVQVAVVDELPFLCMKAAAFDDREKAKDAYDIHFILEHHPGGFSQLAVEAIPHARQGIVKSMLGILEKLFAKPSSAGCTAVADFEEEHDEESREIRLRQVSERIMAFVRAMRGEA